MITLSEVVQKLRHSRWYVAGFFVLVLFSNLNTLGLGSDSRWFDDFENFSESIVYKETVVAVPFVIHEPLGTIIQSVFFWVVVSAICLKILYRRYRRGRSYRRVQALWYSYAIGLTVQLFIQKTTEYYTGNNE